MRERGCCLVPMKKLLILAYDFPPYVSVGGLRPYSWFKYLRQFDVYPIVVTRQWSNSHGNHLDYIAPGTSAVNIVEKSDEGTIIRTPYVPNAANKLMLKHGDSKLRLPRKLISGFYEFGQFIFPIGPKIGIYWGAQEYLNENKVDLIVATGDPFILFKYAAQLSKNHSIPWVADYRDAWIQDKSMKEGLYKKWCAFFEKRFLSNSYKITTVSNFLQQHIGSNVKGKNFEIICNGYLPELTQIAQSVKQRQDTLSVAFAGTLYDWHPIESVFRVCSDLVKDAPNFKIEFNFYGINKEDKLKELLRDSYRSLENQVNFHLRMDNLKLAEAMARQNVFLLFNDYSYLGTKIFDYLALQRKILFCYENDEEAQALRREHYSVEEMDSASKTLQADVIRATNSGLVIRDAAQLKDALLSLRAEIEENGFIACASTGIEEYSRVRQVEKLAAIVHALSHSNKENK